MNPAQVKKDIETRLQNYARQSIPIEKAHPEATDKLLKFFNDPETALLQDPYLELLPRYQAGESLRQLSDDEFIDPMTAEIFADYFGQKGKPEKIKLHSHQADAIKQACNHGKSVPGFEGDGNLVVCSGTGSGKTESFLIPVIDHLVKEWRKETGGNTRRQLSGGVRAMILYPMNALVNDQLSRIRRILKGYPFLTFGRYTGETKTSNKVNSDVEDNITEIIQDFNRVSLGGGSEVDGVLRNEVSSRKKWKASPAHILITNYSMLEYLLIRPETSFLFGETWKHIVLDEAHSYDGAMGAEIGWLMRRLKARLPSSEKIRFIATSATLINRPGLSNEEKESEIRSTFASKIFPASSDSFRVLFGNERKIALGGVDRPASFYCELADTPVSTEVESSVKSALGENSSKILGSDEDWKKLLDLSISAKGAADWCKKTIEVLNALPSKNESITISGALELVQTGYSVLKSGLAPSALNGDCLEKSFFEFQGSAPSFLALAKLLFYGVGQFGQRDAWRDRMHDESEPQGSSLQNDVDNNGRRKKIGNKLHFLWREWLPAFGAGLNGSFDPDQPGTQNLANLSLAGTFWLLDLAHELAVSVDQDVNTAGVEIRPEQVKVVLTRQAFDALITVRKWLVDLKKKIEAAEIALASAWKEIGRGLNLATTPDTQMASEILESWLKEDAKLYSLQQYLRQALNTPNNADHARWSAVQDYVFGGGQHSLCEQALEALIRLTSFAQRNGSREPLLDLRYHQLFRGLNGAGLQFTTGNQGNLHDWQVVQKSEETGELGACRSCGQAYLLAYSNSELGESTLNNGLPHQLLRFIGGDYKYLWALAWSVGRAEEIDLEDAPEAQAADLWFHPQDFKVQKNANNPGDGWFSIVWLKAAGTKEYPLFLNECANCRETRASNDRTTSNTFGLITPYSLTSILRVVALEELSRQADPSSDPIARLFPGEGRKLLAFSDSRGGAARLALNFQNFWIESALAKLLPDVVTDAVNPEYVAKYCNEYSHSKAVIPEHLKEYLNKNQIEQIVGAISKSPDFEAFCCLLAGKLEAKQAGRVLEVSSNDGDDLEPKWAAGILILEALRRVGRNSTMVRGGLGLGLQDLKNIPALCLPDDSFKELLSASLVALYKRCRINIPNDAKNPPVIPWSDETVNPYTEWGRERSPICQKAGAVGSVNFVTGSQGALNQLVSKVLLKTDGWELRIRQIQPAANTNPVVVAFLAVAQNLSTENLRTLATGARFLKEESGGHQEWRECMQDLGFAINSREQSRRNEFKNIIRNEFLNIVSLILQELWYALVPNPHNAQRKALSESDGVYGLNPLPLQLVRIVDQGQQVSKPYDLEYLNQCVRDMIFVRGEEHTAQLSSNAGAAYQRAFARGVINLLSCSTTFEMGVDLGDLSMVFLANLPPSPSNYRQRAGRAGRRPGSPAYVMTYFGDAQHDRYFWGRPAELFFGTLKAPVIHLDNPVIRSRHLRAEALHHFLKSQSDFPHRVERIAPDGTRHTENRGWKNLQDFLIGEFPGGIIKENDQLLYDENRKYSVHYKGNMSSSLVGEHLLKWHNSYRDDLQKYICKIQDVPANLDYKVASDFVWQIKVLDENEIHDFAKKNMYELIFENLPKYQKLGGPNVPEFRDDGSLVLDHDPIRRWRWTPLEKQAELIFKNRAEDGYYPKSNQPRLTGSQRNFLKEKTLEWLASSRVLPKYGFPVDVVELRANARDSYARRVDFERDLKIGLYEYAPGEEVIADKRIYKSHKPGNFTANQGGGLEIRAEHFCESCNEIYQRMSQNDTCPDCNGQLKAENFCNPDYFVAGRSKSGRMRQKPPAARDYLFSGKEHNVQEVNGARFFTAEALSGFITYLNRGSNGRGFPHPEQNNILYTLRHEVRTDIALWLPNEEFFQSIRQWHIIAGKIQSRDYTRFEAGMKSAMQAILRGIILSKKLKGDDVAGLVCPDPRNRQQTGRYGFVLFDNSSGGAGSVQSLALTGINGPEEDMRRASILEVLQEAIKICKNCSCESDLNQGKELAHAPRSREDYLSLQPDEQENNRIRVSCYNCLKSYSNQRDHLFLDRHDAREILELLQGNLSKQGGGGGVSNGPNSPKRPTRGKKVIKEKNPPSSVLRSISKIPQGKVYAKLVTPHGIHEGEARILVWTKEGDKLGVKIKVGDSEEIQVSNQELDTNDVLTIYA